MVHKKSEYELQYHKLTNDIRAQIWKENLIFRESQKRKNSSDHYWRYQLIDDACDCERGSEEDGVLKRWRYLNKTDEAQKPRILYQDMAVQTSDCDETVHKVPHLEESAADVPLELKTPFKEDSSKCTSPVAKADIPENCTTALNGSSSFNQQISSFNEERNKSRENLQSVIHNLNPTSVETPSKDVVHWSHFGLSPSRSALKNYRLKCKSEPVFAAFGCNESNIDVGSHKTYNVRAPENQVHKTALMASGKRLHELELILAEQLKKKRQERSQLLIGPVNSSSIWMTEYQECFSRGQREPLARSAFRRPVVWRYT
ncbi:uncharacterized protein LOC117650226 [Thrips palmi]|uniref:Uncharacterized protein LOC117650226 n=1 Tax=Thrips palmi TaxID=161013 RepID=A0A6P8ZVK7_THRPL|nr:uncharacterized protein LOC117650226 [Thrips palmi]